MVSLGFTGDQAGAKKVVDLANATEAAITKAAEGGANDRVEAEQVASRERVGIIAALGKIFVSMEEDRTKREEKIKKDAATRDEKLQQEREKKAKERRAAALKEIQANATRMAAFALKAVGAVEATALGIVYATDRAAKSMERLNYVSQRTGAAPGKITAFGYAAEQTGGSAEGAQASLENFGAKLRMNPEAYARQLKTMGIEAKDANGHMRDTADIMADLGQKLAAIRRNGPSGYGNAVGYATMFGMDEQTMLATMDPRFRGRMAERQAIDAKNGTDQGAAAAGGTAFEQSMRRLEAMADSIRTKVSTNLFVALTPELDKLAKWADDHGDQIARVIDRIAQDIIALAKAVGDQLAKVDWDGALTALENFGKEFDKRTKDIFGESGPIIATLAVFGALIGSKVLGPLNLVLGTLRTIGAIPLIGRLLGGGPAAVAATAAVADAEMAKRTGAAMTSGNLNTKYDPETGFVNDLDFGYGDKKPGTDDGTSTPGGVWNAFKRLIGLGSDDPDARKVKDAIVATAEGVKKLADSAGGLGGGGGGAEGGGGGIMDRVRHTLGFAATASGDRTHVSRTGKVGDLSKNPNATPENANAIRAAAKELGTTPEDLATVIGYETGGTFSPSKWGGKGGNYMGLIQFGPNERAQYGANDKQTFPEQMGAVVRYLKGRGYKPGMGLMDLYSTINAGSPGHYSASDGNGTVASHVTRMQAGMAPTARAFLAKGTPEPSAMAPVPPGTSAAAVTDAEVFAARQRLAKGGNDPADRALVARYLQGQNTVDDKQHLRNLQLVLRAKHGHVLPYLRHHDHLSASARASVSNNNRQIAMTHNPTYNIHGGDAHSMLADAHRLAGRGQADMVRNLSVMEA